MLVEHFPVDDTEITQEIPAVAPQSVQPARHYPVKTVEQQPLWVKILQLVGGLAFLLAVFLILHIVYVYWGISFDQIHEQETIAAQASKQHVDVDLTSEKIAKPQTSEPPVEGGEPSNEQFIGWMYIPGIETGWKRAIQEGTGLDVLDNGGLGHYKNTPMPGQIGNTAYAGHRTPGDLGYVDRLKPGDAIVIQTAQHWYVYKVMNSWVTVPTDGTVLEAEQPNVRWLTLTTCDPMIATVEASLQHRFIVRARFSYWANVRDGIPQELSTSRQQKPAQFVVNRAKQTVRTISKSAPITPILAMVLLVIWVLFNGLNWLLWRKEREPKPASWSPVTLMWRLQAGPIVLRCLSYVFWWGMLVMVLWAWVSPWVNAQFPQLLTGNPTIG